MERLLICPKCGDKLELTNNTLKCSKGHSYDISKQGYVNLVLGNASSGGDDKGMCKSRHEFHNGDYYRCLSELLARICIEFNCSKILDAGCGEGYYLRKIRDIYSMYNHKLEGICGIDLAKDAISLGSRAEKNHASSSRIEYGVAGIFNMPVADKSVDCVLSVFAPVPDEEAFRVLGNDGIMIVVSPGTKHLDKLKSAVYDTVYDNEIITKNYNNFNRIRTEFVDDEIKVTGENIINLFHMTPYYWKTSEKDFEKLKNVIELTTKIEFVVSIYKKL